MRQRTRVTLCGILAGIISISGCKVSEKPKSEILMREEPIFGPELEPENYLGDVSILEDIERSERKARIDLFKKHFDRYIEFIDVDCRAFQMKAELERGRLDKLVNDVFVERHYRPFLIDVRKKAGKDLDVGRISSQQASALYTLYFLESGLYPRISANQTEIGIVPVPELFSDIDISKESNSVFGKNVEYNSIIIGKTIFGRKERDTQGQSWVDEEGICHLEESYHRLYSHFKEVVSGEDSPLKEYIVKVFGDTFDMKDGRKEFTKRYVREAEKILVGNYHFNNELGPFSNGDPLLERKIELMKMWSISNYVSNTDNYDFFKLWVLRKEDDPVVGFSLKHTLMIGYGVSSGKELIELSDEEMKEKSQKLYDRMKKDYIKLKEGKDVKSVRA